MTTESRGIPPTTRLAPDVADLRAVMRRAANHEVATPSILTVYLDNRPESHGERPYARAEQVTVREELTRIIDEMPAHDPARLSLEDDRRRFFACLDEVPRDVEGVVVFAAAADDLWETAALAAPFATDVVAGTYADLYQLAVAADAQIGSVVAIADSSSCRLFTHRRGRLRELGGPEDDPEEHRRHDQGGWSQAQFQRHIDEQDRRFTERVANEITRIADREHATAIVVAADERTSSVLVPQLPDRTRAILIDIRRISMHATIDEVAAEVGPLLDAVAADRAADAAHRALAGHTAHELGIAGVEPTRRILAAGAVDTLVIDEAAARGLDRWVRADLVRAAVATDATIRFPRDHEGLRGAGGVGATLRYRPGP